MQPKFCVQEFLDCNTTITPNQSGSDSDIRHISCTSNSVHVKTGKKRSGELYISWGYNTEWYTHSNVKIDQPALGNDFTFEDISGHDHKGWDDGVFNKAISIPQYNYRVGYIFNEEKGLGVEINFDHPKFIFSDGQMVHIKGTYGQQTRGQGSVVCVQRTRINR